MPRYATEVRTIKLNKVLIVMILKCLTKKSKQQLSLLTLQYIFYCNKSGAKLRFEIILFMLNTLYFVSLPVGQVKPKNNLPEAISACLGQALLSNTTVRLKQLFYLVKKSLVFLHPYGILNKITMIPH